LQKFNEENENAGSNGRRPEIVPLHSMNVLGAPASRRPIGSRTLELAGETPALPGNANSFFA